MKKAVFYNMGERYQIYDIINSNTFEPDFKEWDESEYDTLDQYQVIAYFTKEIDLPLVRKIRNKLNFSNRRLIIFSDHIDISTKKALLTAGADVVNLIPTEVEELIDILEKVKKSYDRSDNFSKGKLEPFKAAIFEIFNMMAMTDVEVIEEYLCTEKLHFGEITGLMSLAGKKKGLLLLTINESLSRRIISSIMAIPEEDLQEEDIHDGIAEIVNMISGGAKARLSDTEEHFLISAPTVITGHKHRIIQPKDMPCVAIVYRVGEEYFAVKLCLLSLMR